MQRNILFILPEYYPHSGGGISTYYINYINALRPFCGKIKVIVGSGYVQANDSYNLDGVVVEYLKPDLYKKYLARFTNYDLFPEFRNNLAAAWAMWQQAQNDADFNIVECTDFGLGFIPWVIKHEKPVITRMHGSSGQIALHEDQSRHQLSAHLFQTSELNLLPRSDVLVTYSKSNQAFWNNLLPPKTVRYIQPIYSSQSTPLPKARRENFGLVTARIQKWKGPEMLSEAITISSILADIQWYGRDTLFDDHESTSSFLKKSYPNVFDKRIIFKPALSLTQVQELQRKAKFGLVTSTWDMFNFTLLEFLASGTPVICSDGAGAADLIEHGVNGFKYPANDTTALAECLNLINKLDDNAYMTMAMAGIKSLEENLNTEKLLKINIEAYNSAIENFKQNTVNRYLEEIYQPAEMQHSIDSVLDRQPFKILRRYMIKRIRKKLAK